MKIFHQMTILDIHTHHAPPQPHGVVALSVADLDSDIIPGQLYSVGIHPWTTTGELRDTDFEALEAAASRPEVVAIGECGIDIPKGGPLFRQMKILKFHLELSERVRKPLILHCVKGQEIIISMRKEMKAEMPWVVHGFRGKPSVAEMLLRAGLWLSLGSQFNETSLGVISADRLLAETDDSAWSIEEVIASLSEKAGSDLSAVIAANSARFLGL